MTDEKIEIVKGSGNVFGDLGHANPDIELMRATLAAEIIRVLDTRKLSVRKAGEIAQVQYADISRVRNADLNKFTVDWLVKVFSRLEPKVEMSLKFSERSFGTSAAAPMYFSEENLEKLQEKRQEILEKYEKLMLGYTMRTYTNEQAKEYATHGFSRRIGILARCIENIFEKIPPNQVDLPAKESLSDVIINIHAFVFNVFGSIDNLAWILVCEKGITDDNGKQIHKNSVGLGKKNKVIRNYCSTEFQEYLKNLGDWFDHLENFRHALAHRIPLYIPPYMVPSDQEAEYKSLENRMQNAFRCGDFAQHDRLSVEQRKLCFFRPLMMHSFKEDSKPIVFHAQIIADFNTVDELGHKVLNELSI